MSEQPEKVTVRSSTTGKVWENVTVLSRQHHGIYARLETGQERHFPADWVVQDG